MTQPDIFSAAKADAAAREIGQVGDSTSVGLPPGLQAAPLGMNPADDGMSCAIEIHDSEIAALQEVLGILNERAGLPRNYEAFQREIIERFGEINFKVDVKWFTTNVDGVLAPRIEIIDRIEGEFDPDKQVHEVTSDLLDLGEGGVIKTGMHKGDLIGD